MKKQIAELLVIALMSPVGVATPVLAQQSDSAAQATTAAPAAPSDNPVAPAAEQAAAEYPDAPTPAQSAQQPASTADSSSSQALSEAQETSPQKPVGTAAAPYEKTTGVPGSRPAGAVIAPAKQHRMRAIFISVGVIVAAGVAAGTVIGLSNSSPSRP